MADSGRWQQTARERFDDSYIPEPNTGCWLWMKFANQGGYGQSYMNGKLVYAHRMAWELYRGPIPPGMQIDQSYVPRSVLCQSGPPTGRNSTDELGGKQ